MNSPPELEEDRSDNVVRVTAETYASVRPTDTVVLLLSGEGARETAAERALELSASWAAAGLRIVLADLHLDRPLLEAQSAEGPLEGIVDVFLYGASLSRLARPAPEGGFFLIPAGTYSPDPAEVFRSPRWKKVVAGFRDTGATLLLFVPAENPDLGELAAWASEAILLDSSDAKRLTALLRDMGITVLAAVDPPVGTAPTAAVGGALTEPPEVVAAGVMGPQVAGEELASTAARPHAFQPDQLELPPPPPRTVKRRRAVFFATILAALAILTVLYLLAALRPDLLSMEDPSAEINEDVRSVVTASREGQLLHYSVHVKAFTSLAAASNQLAVEQRRLGNVPFFISPEEIQGVLYYRIMAGLSNDTTGAILLRQRLVEVGAVEEDQAISTYGLLQFAPLAFDLGEYLTREAAMARADSLLALDIPSYVAVIPYSDGTRRWQVYGGAFRDSAGAERMAALLSAAGVQSQLTVRAGEPAPDPE